MIAKSRYFPELYNLTSDKSEAIQYNFEDLSDLSGVDTCEMEDIKDLRGKVNTSIAPNGAVSYLIN